MILLGVAAVSFGLLALAWLVYPALMWMRSPKPGSDSSFGPRSLESDPERRERVVVVVATRDDPAFALERVRNLRSADYPPELLRVVIAVDANAPHDLDAYRQRLAGVADVIRGDQPGGKAAALNAGVRAAAGADVLVFADVGQQFGPDAITRLVHVLRGGEFGAVTGRYTHARTDGIMSAYADLEALIRAGQAAGHSVVSATGAILAMRPALWRDLPSGLICDDLFTGLSVVRQRSRVGFCPEAVAFDPRVFSRDQQFTRRVRTLTGLIQYCIVEPGALFPWSNPVWGHFFVHKILRLLTPLLLGIGAAALALWFVPRFPVVSLMVLAGLAVVALLVRHQAIWAFRLMLVPVVAISNGVRGRWSVWTPTSQVRADLRTGA